MRNSNSLQRIPPLGARIGVSLLLVVGLSCAGRANAQILIQEAYSLAFDIGSAAIYVKPQGMPWRGFDILLDEGTTLFDVEPDFNAAQLMIYAANDPIANADLDGHLFGGDGGRSAGPVALHSQRGGPVLNPAFSGTFSVDPGDTNLDADFFVVPGGDTASALLLTLSAADEAVFYDVKIPGDTPRRTPLAVLTEEQTHKPPKLKVVATEAGNLVAALATTTEFTLFDLGDLDVPGPLSPTILGTIPANASFDPDTGQVFEGDFFDGTINAIEASVQDGDTIRSFSFNGVTLATGPTQTIPADAANGCICNDGSPLVYYYTQGATIFRGTVGETPSGRIQGGDVRFTYNSLTPASTPTSLESFGGNVNVVIEEGFAPLKPAEFTAAGDATVVAHEVAHVVQATGDRAAAVRSVADGLVMSADTIATGERLSRA